MELTLDLNKRYTYADYLMWLDDKRRELINGLIKMMSPAPHPRHAAVNFKIAWQLEYIIKRNKGKCEVYHAPFDVRFPRNGETANNQINTVVQPDICVICDLSKIDNRGCCGAPDMIVEILSPSTLTRDVHEKFVLYEEFGVKEYWIVHPNDKSVNVFILQEDGKYDAGTLYENEGKVPVYIFDNCTMDLNDIFKK